MVRWQAIYWLHRALPTAWIDTINRIPLCVIPPIHRSRSQHIPTPRIACEEDAQPRIHVPRPQVNQARRIDLLHLQQNHRSRLCTSGDITVIQLLREALSRFGLAGWLLAFTLAHAAGHLVLVAVLAELHANAVQHPLA